MAEGPAAGPRGANAWALAALAAVLLLHGVLLWPHVSATTSDFDAIHLYFPLAQELKRQGVHFFTLEQSLHAPPFSYVYPALLGAQLTAVKQANFALSFLTLLLVFRTAWLAHSRLAGIAAALLFAACPLLHPVLAAPLSEPPYLFLGAAWIWALAEWLAGARAMFVLVSGLALGLAILTRGTLFYLPVALAVTFAALAWKSAAAERARALGAMGAHLIALVLPGVFIAKNWLLFSFPFFATGAGNALYLGNNPLTGGYDPVYLGLLFDVGSIARDQSHLTLEAERLLRGAARLAVGDSEWPMLAALHAQKLAAFVFVTNAEVSQQVPLLRTWRIVLVVLAAAGAWSVRRSWIGWVLAATVAYQAAAHMPVLYTHRYSVGAIDLWLILLAGVGIACLRRPQPRRALLAVGAVMAAGLAAGYHAYRYGGVPQPEVFRAARLHVWEGSALRREFAGNETTFEVPVRNAPRFHPWNNHVLVMDASLSSAAGNRACGWARLDYRRDSDPAFSAAITRRIRPDGMRHAYQVGAVIPMQMNAEGVLRIRIACPGGGALDITRLGLYAPMGGMDYRARLLGEPIPAELER